MVLVSSANRAFVCVRCSRKTTNWLRHVEICNQPLSQYLGAVTFMKYCDMSRNKLCSYLLSLLSKILFFSCAASNRFWAMASPYGALRSHSLDTPHTAGLLWTNDRPDSKISTRYHTTVTRNKHPFTPAGFKPTIPVNERTQTHAWDRAVTGISFFLL
jgi:hypothetical protein